MITPINQAKVVIVTINYNGLDDTFRLLSNLKNIDEDVGVIVVDNNSSNNEADKIASKYEVVKVIKSQINGGFGYANNLGAAYCLDYSNIEYLFVLNNDTVINSGVISKLYSTIEANTDILCVSPVILNQGGETIWFGGGDFSSLHAGAKSWFKNKVVDQLKGAPPIIESPFISGCAMFLSKESYSDIGGFDDKFFMYIEDIDFSYRINLIGRAVVSTEVSIEHFAHSSLNIPVSLATPIDKKNPSLNFYIEHVIKGSFFFYRKHFSLLKRMTYYVFLFLKWQKNILKIGSISKAVVIYKTYFKYLVNN
ncbi:MAG: glycosyltransferase family 2 protein [Porticoccaceae bacterium]|nr:glycosyltransferase family 2 protein [Porticoccaceae bacterium]